MKRNGSPRALLPAASSAWFLLGACLALLAALGACAPLHKESPRIPRGEADSTWTAFWSDQDRLAPLPGASLKGSLNIFTPEQKRRVTFELWGNPPTPLRLHLRAGMGATISLWEIRANRVQIFSPHENLAYIAESSAGATAAMGMRLPFGLPRMMQLLTDSWDDLLPREYERAEVVPGQGYAFYFSGEQRIHRVVLDETGRVVSLSGDRPYAWTLERKDPTSREGRSLSQRVELTTERDEELILRVKEFELREEPWPEEDLRLSLPQDTMIRVLRPEGSSFESP